MVPVHEIKKNRDFRARGPLVFLAAFLPQWLRLPYLGALNSDAWSYDGWAMEIARGGLVRSTAFSQSPPYPYSSGGFLQASSGIMPPGRSGCRSWPVR